MPATSEPRWNDVPATLASIFTRPSRLRQLIVLGPAGWFHASRYLRSIVPAASRALRAIRADAATIPSDTLRAAALSSIDEKAYHVQGACIFATFLRNEARERYIRIVTPLETMYDYLDTLCDRVPGVGSEAYPVLHDALLDALDRRRRAVDYYRAGPAGDDGGYLRRRVDEVRNQAEGLAAYDAVASRARESARFYARLQYLKHLSSGERESRCERWYGERAGRFPSLEWWEFAAACGSSLPVFAMLFAASRPASGAQNIASLYDAYFPHVSAVHILLDYFIDQAEDRAHGELNFVECYGSSELAARRLGVLVRRAVDELRRLEEPDEHLFIFRAMCTFYLTHPKVFEQRLEKESRVVLAALG